MTKDVQQSKVGSTHTSRNEGTTTEIPRQTQVELNAHLIGVIEELFGALLGPETNLRARLLKAFEAFNEVSKRPLVGNAVAEYWANYRANQLFSLVERDTDGDILTSLRGYEALSEATGIKLAALRQRLSVGRGIFGYKDKNGRLFTVTRLDPGQSIDEAPPMPAHVASMLALPPKAAPSPELPLAPEDKSAARLKKRNDLYNSRFSGVEGE